MHCVMYNSAQYQHHLADDDAGLVLSLDTLQDIVGVRVRGVGALGRPARDFDLYEVRLRGQLQDIYWKALLQY